MTSTSDNEELLHHILKTLANEHYKLRLFNDPEARRRAASRNNDGDLFEQDVGKMEVEFDADEFEVRVCACGGRDDGACGRN